MAGQSSQARRNRASEAHVHAATGLPLRLTPLHCHAVSLSLGATGELTAAYSKRTPDTLGTTTTELSSLDVGASLVRVMVSVYF